MCLHGRGSKSRLDERDSKKPNPGGRPSYHTPPPRTLVPTLPFWLLPFPLWFLFIFVSLLRSPNPLYDMQTLASIIPPPHHSSLQIWYIGISISPFPLSISPLSPSIPSGFSDYRRLIR